MRPGPLGHVPMARGKLKTVDENGVCSPKSTLPKNDAAASEKDADQNDDDQVDADDADCKDKGSTRDDKATTSQARKGKNEVKKTNVDSSLTVHDTSGTSQDMHLATCTPCDHGDDWLGDDWMAFNTDI